MKAFLLKGNADLIGQVSSHLVEALKNETSSVDKIPPNLPLSKGGISDPSLAKRGEGRFFQSKSYFEIDSKCRGNDYSGSIVVFPGKRPAHFLRRHIAGKHGQAFIPPRTCSMDEFIDLLCAKQEVVRQIDSIDAAAILFDLHRKAPKPLGNKGFLSLDSFFPIAMKLGRDLEELFIESVSIEDLKHADGLVQEGIPPGSLERLQAVSWFYEHFYQEVREQGFSTRSMRYCFAAETFETTTLSPFSQIVLAGFFALTTAEKALFRKLAMLENTSMFFQAGPGMQEMLASLEIDPEVIERGERAPVVSLYQSPDTHGQTFGLNSVIRGIEKSGGAFDEKTVIVLPSADTLFPLLSHGISAIPEDRFNISMGYPLNRTPIFGFFNNLSQMMLSMEGERLYLPDYLKFVLHPYVKNILFRERADVTRIIFHTLEDAMTENRTRSFLTLEELEHDRKMLGEITKKIAQVEQGITAEQVHDHLKNIHDRLIRRFLTLSSLSDFAQKTAAVLEYIYENSTAKLHPYFHPFAEAFMSAMQTISVSLMKDLAFDEPDSYFHFFRKYLGTCHVPFPGTPLKGLQVLGFLETRNLTFDRVLILDMNEDVIPATDRDESLLPFKARMALHLPTYLDRDRMTSYYFETLLRSCREAHLFFVENSRKEKSRFVERLLWDMQKKDGEIRPDNYLQAVFYDVKLDSRKPAAIAKTAAVLDLLQKFEYSASSLDSYLNCRLQFYYRYVLRISEREGVSSEIERADIGRFVHDLLHDFFMDKQGRPLTAEDLSEDVMNTMIAAKFRKEYGQGATGSLYLLKMQILRHLRDFLKGYQAAMLDKGPIEILELESDLKITWNSFVLKGRLDRVEKREDRIYIIDYKTQANDNYLRIRHDRLDPDERDSWSEAIGSLQLPLYLLLLSEARGIAPEQITPLFLFLGRMRLDREIESPLFKEGDPMREQYEVLKKVILGLLMEVTNPELPFAPAQDLKAACPLCDFRNICGTQWIVKKR